jgi:hypothetical protein
MDGGSPENIARVLEIVLQRPGKSIAAEIPASSGLRVEV